MYTVRMKNGLQWSFMAAGHTESLENVVIRRSGLPDIMLLRHEVVFVRQKAPSGEVELWSSVPEQRSA